MATDIYLLGVGISPRLHVTAETQQAIRACGQVLVLHPDGEVEHLLTEINPNAEIIDVARFYDGARLRQDVYTAISKDLVARAVASSAPVGFVVHGHPLFLVSAAEYTLELARENGLNVRVLPAVSSFDTLMCDLGVDYGYALQIFDTTTLLSSGWGVNPEIPLLLFQLATTNNPEVVMGSPAPKVLGPVADLLRRFYPGAHQIVVAHSSTSIWEAAEMMHTTVDELAQSAISLNRRPTLYVPPLTDTG